MPGVAGRGQDQHALARSELERSVSGIQDDIAGFIAAATGSGVTSESSAPRSIGLFCH